MIDKYHEAKDQLKLQKVESKGYGVIYKLPMLDKDLDVVAKAFYAYICSYAGAGDTAFPGMDKICHDLGVSRQRLERHRKALIEKGYITINQVKDKGRFSHNEYTINKTLSPVLQNATTEKPTTEIPTTENVTYNNNIFNNNNINNNNKTSSPKFSTFDMEAAEKLYNLILINNPNHKKPNLEKWANDVRLMRIRDNRTEEQIMYVIEWSQNDNFWKSNILSIAKLREKFDTLVIRIKSEKENKVNKTINKTKQDAMSMMLEQLNFGGYENEPVNEPRRDQLLISEDGSTL